MYLLDYFIILPSCISSFFETIPKWNKQTNAAPCSANFLFFSQNEDVYFLPLKAIIQRNNFAICCVSYFGSLMPFFPAHVCNLALGKLRSLKFARMKQTWEQNNCLG